MKEGPTKRPRQRGGAAAKPTKRSTHRKSTRRHSPELPVPYEQLKRIARAIAEKYLVHDESRLLGDLVNEALLHVITKVDLIDKADNPLLYTKKVIRNYLKDVYRRARDHEHIVFTAFGQDEHPEGEEPDGEAYDGSWKANGSAAQVMSREYSRQRRADILSRVREAVALLPEEQREAIQLRFEESLKLQEIATVLATSQRTVERMFHAAFERLRALLHDLSDYRGFDLTEPTFLEEAKKLAGFQPFVRPGY